MEKQEPITIINVDEVPHAVSDMSDNVKRLVSIYNDWRNDETSAKSELLKCQAGMRDLSREIVMTIKQEKEAKAQQEAAVVAAQQPNDIEKVVPADLEAIAKKVTTKKAPAKKKAAAKKGAVNAK